MNKYVVEMSYGIGFSLNVEAKDYDEAIKNAKAIIDNDVTIIETGRNSCDCGDLEFEEVSFIKEIK